MSKLAEIVNQVLSFWFDGDIRVNYKTKWFPSGNPELQHEADMLVNSLFSDILTSAMDENTHEEWLKLGLMGEVALIIVLDQFSRHIFRLLNLPPIATERAIADKLALRVADRLHIRDGESLHSKLTVPQYIFSVMPFRHSATTERLKNVLQSVENREAMINEDIELINRFRKQTTRRLQHLEDRAKVI